MNKIKAILFVLALGVIVLVLAGCGAGGSDISGTVVGKGYSPEHYDPCASWAKVCFGDNVDAAWYLLIQDNVDDSGYIWVPVTQGAYQHYRNGDAYP